MSKKKTLINNTIAIFTFLLLVCAAIVGISKYANADELQQPKVELKSQSTDTADTIADTTQPSENDVAIEPESCIAVCTSKVVTTSKDSWHKLQKLWNDVSEEFDKEHSKPEDESVTDLGNVPSKTQGGG